jgi:type VI protein secretion system component VasK
MGDSHDNYGISGGNVQATNLAVGSSARVEINAPADLSTHFGELQRAVAAYDGPPEARAQLTTAVQEVATELERPEPDKGRLLAKLTDIGTVAGAASAVAGVATTLASVVGHVL